MSGMECLVLAVIAYFVFCWLLCELMSVMFCWEEDDADDP